MDTVLLKPSFFDIYSCLPLTKRQQIEIDTKLYLKKIDKAITEILSPNIGKTENQFLISDECIPLYGVGNTPKEAMEDYRSAVIEYYESLEEDAEQLTCELKHQLDILRRIFNSVTG